MDSWEGSNPFKRLVFHVREVYHQEYESHDMQDKI